MWTVWKGNHAHVTKCKKHLIPIKLSIKSPRWWSILSVTWRCTAMRNHTVVTFATRWLGTNIYQQVIGLIKPFNLFFWSEIYTTYWYEETHSSAHWREALLLPVLLQSMWTYFCFACFLCFIVLNRIITSFTFKFNTFYVYRHFEQDLKCEITREPST